jgi:hypothetical protein
MTVRWYLQSKQMEFGGQERNKQHHPTQQETPFKTYKVNEHPLYDPPSTEDPPELASECGLATAIRFDFDCHYTIIRTVSATKGTATLGNS